MSDIILEGEIKGAIDPATISQTKTILKQMQNSVCRISGVNFGTGFFCKIDTKKGKTSVLITNYHIINDEFISSGKSIKIYLGDESIPKMIKLNENRKVYSSDNKKYDIMIIEIYERDDIKNINYLELDDYLLNTNSEYSYEDSSIYIIHYPSGGEIKVSLGYGIKKKDENSIIHKCKTSNGSSGSPIFNLSSNKIIGIHKSFERKNNKECYNLGTLLKYPLIDMKKENTKNISKNIKISSNNKRLNNKISKTNKISNINNAKEEKIVGGHFDKISNRQYNHEHFNTDINNNDSEYDSNLKKNENISNNKILVTNQNKINLKNRNIVKRIPQGSLSFAIKINNPLRKKETINEEDMPNLNINKELENRVSIPSKINLGQYSINNIRNNYMNNEQKIIERRIFKNKKIPQNIIVNNTFQKKNDFPLDSAKKNINNNRDFKHAPSTPIIKNYNNFKFH